MDVNDIHESELTSSYGARGYGSMHRTGHLTARSGRPQV